MPIVSCKKCSKDFSAKPSLLKRGGGIYCSKVCHYGHKRRGQVVKCFVCTKEIYRKPRALALSKSKKYFCSKPCQAVWRNMEFVGPKHTNWKDGASTYRGILLRTGKPCICARCGTEDFRILSVHHIDGDHGNNEVSNLAWLCFNCHHLVHHDKVEKQKFRKLFLRNMAAMV